MAFGGWRVGLPATRYPPSVRSFVRDLALRKRFLELRRGNGEAEVEALNFPAAVIFQEVELRLGLHSLCDNAKIEALRQLDHRADDGRVLESIGEILDEVPVDLQTVDREAL